MLGLMSSIFLVFGFVTQAASNDNELQQIFSEVLAQHAPTLHSVKALQRDGAITGYGLSCFQKESNFSTLFECLNAEMKCLSISKLAEIYSMQLSQKLTSAQVKALSPALVFSLISCNDSNEHSTHSKDNSHKASPHSEASWGYSFLFVTVINLCSLTGALVLPCMKLHSYKIILMFMVGIAVGTLAGSGLLFLIPEAFALVHDDDTAYIWKASTVMGGIYLFYLIEKLLRYINNRRENTSSKKTQDEAATKDVIVPSFRRTPVDNTLPGRDPPEDLHNVCTGSRMEGSLDNSETNIPDNLDVTVCVSTSNTSGLNTTQLLLPKDSDSVKHISNGHGHSHGIAHRQGDVAPVAYMIIFGDAVHNFIDGLSIGSAFTVSIMTGISVSVAIMCEELPHELGDFAILLNSGMPFKRAIMYNFLSACTCYLGTVIGILLGENTESSEWIFAIAGGMFLYISLVDMMPEMNTAAESEEAQRFGVLKTFLIQNLGLLTGYSIMLVMALYSGKIQFEA